MHESSLARQLLEAVLRATPEHSQVRHVRCELAETEALSPQAITFHFHALAKGTPAEVAELEVNVHHIEAKCQQCGVVYAPDHHLTLCPDCGCTEAELLGQPGVAITSIDVEDA